MRILVLNNYPFQEVWEEIKQGKKPAHHLYGVDVMEREGHEVILVPFRKSQFWMKLSKWISKIPFIEFGDLDQQVSALKMLNQCDVVYSPCQTQTWLLSYLRAIGLVRKPIVSIGHHPFVKGRFPKLRIPFLRWSFAGTDAYPALSEYVANEIRSLCKSTRTKPLFWGPDMRYYAYKPSLGNYVVVSGRTGRDYLTFGKAANQTNVPSKIICLKRDYKDEFTSFGNNVEVVCHDKSIDYHEMCEIYQNARIIAIPFVHTHNLCGLTSLTDALAMGKPVIMTKTEFIDLDIEKEGIGIWVESGDEEGWRNAIEKIYSDENLAQQMGLKARKLAESRLNYNEFSCDVIELLEKVVQKDKSN